MKKKIIAVIPARYGSTRLQAKPLIKIKNKTIIEYVYSNICQSKIIDKVIVATDDSRISDEVRTFGGAAVMTPETCASGTDRIAYIIAQSEYNDYDIVVNVQGDEPLLKHTEVDKAINSLIQNDSDVSTLAVKFSKIEDIKNPNCVKVVINKNFEALYFSRSIIPYPRDTEINIDNYLKHIGVYVFKKEILLNFTKLPASKLEQTEKLEQLRLLENGCKISIALTEFDTIGLDTPEDLEKLKNIL
ncbi:MAG TPA: 3-deoxy-manno-octulosonate cytidylyltransferase [bacterium]|nr:3-deoxy-manno-octulosonate cytidylyltransferase [bacterium]HPP87037.1 3-deoxy-manno-octulosonate cytidylyltransferase [bacterium]